MEVIMSHPLFKLFNKAFYINLDKRKDRRIFIEKQLSMFGIEAERFPGIINEYNGHKGCLLSHRNIIQRSIDENLGNILIIEDDCEFINEFNNKCEVIINDVMNVPNWDLLFFHFNACCNRDRTKKITDNIMYIMGTLQTHFYGINCKSFNKIINIIKSTPNEAIDRVYIANDLDLDVVATSTNLTKQKSGYSDTANDYVIH